MTRARDVANVLSTATSLATDTETAAAISSHNSVTTSVHGISNTATLATQTYADSAVSTHAAAADPHSVYLKESEFGAAGKNLVINGGFDIWQRGTSFATGSFQYSADRWRVGRGAFESGATFSRQNADLQGFRYCVRAQRNSGNTTTGGGYLATSFETSDSLRFSGQPVVLSFYAKKSSGFTGFGISVVLQNGTGIDELNFTESNFATGANNIINSAASTLTTSWQRFTYTGTVPSNSTQLGIRFVVAYSGTAPADDYVDITGVQLEVGSVVTPFSRAGGTLQGELAACQRYYYRITSQSNYGYLTGPSATASTNGTLCPLYLPVTMRTIPTLLEYANIRLDDAYSLAYSITTATIQTTQSTPQTLNINVSAPSQTVVGRWYLISANNNPNAYIGVGAEL